MGETRKCDSEREEWCAVILALALTLALTLTLTLTRTRTRTLTPSARSGATGRPILTLTLSLSLDLTLTLTLSRCDGAAKSALPEGGDPKECQAAGDVTDDWCVSNCGFTPPNCPEALCKCAKPSDKGASAADTSKAQAEGKPTLSPFAKAFERNA